MSRLFGEIRQIGHVVRDVKGAMRFWSEHLGVGPFFVMPEVELQEFVYRGRPSPAPVITMAFAFSGTVQIELIQQHNDVPSGFREFLTCGREGVQHVSSWCSSSEEYDRIRGEAEARGMVIVHETGGRGGAARFAYFETGTPDAPLFEVSEAMIPAFEPFMRAMAAASTGWDGADPVRLLL